MRKVWLAGIVVAALVALLAPPVGTIGGRVARAGGSDPLVALAGDIACAPPGNQTARKCHQDATARLLAGATKVLALGDEQYPCGLLNDFKAVYDRSWGGYTANTYPVPGDNEYLGNSGCSSGPGADGYFAYFGDRATPLQPGCTASCRGWYSTDIGEWHVVALNSECAESSVGGCATTSAQYRWLVDDLAANSTTCTLAFMHKPYWGNGIIRAKTKSLVNALNKAGAELVLSGHDHLYIRFAPQNLSNKVDSRGIRQFVVGTGGASLATAKRNLPHTEVKDATQFGVLRLTLHPRSYDWRFVSDDAASTVVDSGTTACH